MSKREIQAGISKIPIYFWIMLIGLPVLDQSIKLCICHYWNSDMTQNLIPGILEFRIRHNTNLSWLGSLTKNPVLTNPLFINLLNIVLFYILGSLYLYCFIIREVQWNILTVAFGFGIAGTICSAIDKMFWGGSLDYVGLFDWFVFDLKDVYITIFEMIVLVLVLIHWKHLNKYSARDLIQILLWIVR